jgi:hypothetical protein
MAALLLATTACVKTVDGGSKAGWPAWKDTIKSKYEMPLDKVVIAARKTLAENGTITKDDIANNALVAKVNTSTVFVKITEDQPGVTLVLTQARKKGGGGHVDLAAEIDKQIALNLQ